MFLPNQTHPQVSKIEAVYEVKKFHVVKNTTDPATKEVWSCFKMCNFIPIWNNKQEMIFFSDNTNQCDCYRICLDDHIQNATLGIPGSCQQVQSRYLQKILFY